MGMAMKYRNLTEPKKDWLWIVVVISIAWIVFLALNAWSDRYMEEHPEKYPPPDTITVKDPHLTNF